MHWLCAQHGRQVRVAGVDASTAHRVVVKIVVDEAAVDADREAPAIVAGVADGLVRGTAERPTRLTLVVLEVDVFVHRARKMAQAVAVAVGPVRMDPLHV